MDRSGRTPVNPLKRLSTITEYSEPGTPVENDLETDQSTESGFHDVLLSENTKEDKPVEYFLLDDSPMARFARNVKWAYQKLPVGGGGAVLVLSELESMAARQQREIAQQRRLLEQREARLAVLRGAQEPAQQERLARLRHRLDQQQSKLNRLRLLRSQTDQSRANNATLTSDLDCIRALFNEKEKELSLAVAKVEELTRQLEDLRGRHNGNGGSGNGQVPSAASAELEKLRRELMYRNKMNEQQNQVVSQQRLVLAQRQAEMASIDARIAQLQGRLQRKRALNQRLLSQQLNNRQSGTTNSPGYEQSTKQQEFTNPSKLRPAGNVAAIEPYSHIPNDSDFNLNKNDPKYQTLPYNTKFTVNLKPIEDDVNKNKIQHSQSASQIGQRTTLQQLGHQIAHSQSQSHIQGQSQLLGSSQQQPQQNSPQSYPQSTTNFFINSANNNNNNNNTNTNNNNNSSNQQFSVNNPGNFTPDNQTQLTRHQPHQQSQSQNLQSIQQKQQLGTTNSSVNQETRQSLNQSITQAHNHRNLQTHQKPVSSVAPSFPVKSPIYQTSSIKINPVMPQTLSLIGRGHSASQNYQERANQQNSSPQGQQQQQSSGTNDQNFPSRHNYQQFNQAFKNTNYPGYAAQTFNQNENERIKFDGKLEKFDGKTETNQHKFDLPGTHQYGKHEHDSRIAKYDGNSQFKQDGKCDNSGQKYDVNQSKHDHGVKLEPPGKLQDKAFDNDRKTMNFGDNKSEDKMKPALPPKPVKPNPPPRLNNQDKDIPSETTGSDVKASVTRTDKEEEVPPIPTTEPPESPNEPTIGSQHQIIKARPLTLKKALLSEQPRLRYAKSNVHVSINRRIEMPPAFLFPETEIPADLMQTDQQLQNTTDVTDHINLKQLTQTEDNNTNDKLEDSDIVDALNVINIEDKLKKESRCELDSEVKNEVMRRKKGNLKSTTGKANLSRRVSFDPLALLLDASLEGELELVKKTAKEVANPSSANDEGITALHNAICAGHLDIVKFLVEFGCDVNAQDSDGWTPLHCAASCNNLAMVRFLVEHGACIFATTLSDHETAAEKCEEDEEGFDGCSEYLYSVQEKLGIMNNGQVFAVFDYDAQHNDELSLKNGDQLVILRKGDDNEREWWWSKLGHREGYVPRNLLGLYPRVQPSKTD